MKNKLILFIGIFVLGFTTLALRPSAPAENVCLNVSSEVWNASEIIIGTCHYYLTIEGEVKSCNHENCGQCRPSTCIGNPPVCIYTVFSEPIER